MPPVDEQVAAYSLGRAKEISRSLYPHQVEGLAFLLGRRRSILADDMGLGKTRQSILGLTEATGEGPYLIVCPASVKRNWVREILMVLPQAQTQIAGPEPVPGPGYRGWVILNYDILHRQVDALLARVEWTGLRRSPLPQEPPLHPQPDGGAHSRRGPWRPGCSRPYRDAADQQTPGPVSPA